MTTFDGLDEAALCRLTGAPRVALHATVGSTLDVAHALAAQGAPTGTVALADEQTAGRGRAGRAWHSPAGAGLWLSIVLRPAAPPAGGTLAIRTGLAAHAALRVAAPGLEARLKWPNDIVAAGRKLGGILCEAHWSGEQVGWVAVGVGLNVHGPLDPAVAALAGTIAEFDADVTRLGVLAELAPRLGVLAALAPRLDAREQADYLDRLWMPEGTAPVVGIEPDGALLLRRPDGGVERRVDAD